MSHQSKVIISFIFATLFSFCSAQDVVLSLDGGNLNYESSADIAGFQFFHNGCVTGASGGDAAAAGFSKYWQDFLFRIAKVF